MSGAIYQDLEKIIDDYEKLSNSSLPWFLDGKPGKPGMDRLEDAKVLLEQINKEDDYASLFKLCEFYKKHYQQQKWHSRLISKIGHLIDEQLNTRWVPPATISTAAMLGQVTNHDRRRWYHINRVLKNPNGT